MMLTYTLANPLFINNEVPFMLACPFLINNEVNLEIDIIYIPGLTRNDDLHIIRGVVAPYL